TRRVVPTEQETPDHQGDHAPAARKKGAPSQITLELRPCRCGPAQCNPDRRLSDRASAAEILRKGIRQELARRHRSFAPTLRTPISRASLPRRDLRLVGSCRESLFRLQYYWCEIARRQRGR